MYYLCYHTRWLYTRPWLPSVTWITIEVFNFAWQTGIQSHDHKVDAAFECLERSERTTIRRADHRVLELPQCSPIFLLRAELGQTLLVASNKHCDFEESDTVSMNASIRGFYRLRSLLFSPTVCSLLFPLIAKDNSRSTKSHMYPVNRHLSM